MYNITIIVHDDDNAKVSKITDNRIMQVKQWIDNGDVTIEELLTYLNWRHTFESITSL